MNRSAGHIDSKPAGRRRLLRGMAGLVALRMSAPLLPALPLLTLVGGCAASTLQLSGASMGTRYRVSARGSALSADMLRAEVEAALGAVDRRMSTYRPASDIGRLNQAAPGQPVAVSADTAAVLGAADTVHRLSGGAFDASIGPLVHAWGFGAAAAPAGLPAPGALAAARARVGWQALERERGGVLLRKQVAGLALDLSAIAKGYAVDRVAAALRAAGVRDAVVEVGGEVRCMGEREDGGPWRVGVELPAAGAPRPVRTLAVHDGALATSGTYRNVRDVDGRRYSHTIDPRSGAPVDHALASVTVFAADAMMADAWATALLVLGERAGPRLADDLGLPVLFMWYAGSDLMMLESAALAAQPAGEGLSA